MFRRKPLSFAVRHALSVAVAATAAVPTVSQAQDSLQEVVVTGSRIATDPNLSTSSPVTSLKADEIEFRGITRVEDLLNDLPQVVPEFTNNESNGSNGTATVDLRGLSSDRTLVLTNGHRMGFGDPDALAPDINQIPGALVERVEILTGGASSTYGSDALAGVVNFIMRDDFEGVQIDYQYSANQHSQSNQDVQDALDTSAGNNPGQTPAQFVPADDSVWDGDTHDINLIMGVNSPDGKGNITAYVGYRDISDVLQSERDFSACALSTSNGVTCSGSATSAEGLFTDFYGNYYTVDGTDFVPGFPTYNYGPLNYFQRPDERYTAGLFAHYEVNEHFEAYSEFQFMDDRSLAQIAPSGAFFVTGTISCDNPLMSAQQAATINSFDNFDETVGHFDPVTGAPTAPNGATDYPCVPGNGDTVPWYIGRRNVEGGPRFEDLRHTSYRLLGGIKGEINDDWSYDSFANFSRLVYNANYQNDMSITRIQRSLDVVDVGGVPTCQSVVDGSDPNCVPYNVFQQGGVTQDAIDYLTLPLFQDAELTQDQYVGFVSGDLTSMGFVSPMASEGVKVVLGGEYRDEHLDFNPDQSYQSGDAAGQGATVPPVHGQIDVAEFFLEAHVPLVEDKEWAKSVSVDLGYRYSDYSTGISTDTYKAIGEWTPMEGYKLRGGYSRAVRAGNLSELFAPQQIALWSEGGDPCAGPTPDMSAAACANTGVSAGQYGFVPDSPAGQFNGIFGGNPDLDPEKANTFTIGAVITPEEFIPGLQVSVDYWSIEIKDAITNVEPFTIITQCGATADPTLCGLINRGPNGNLWINSANAFVTSTNVNIGFFDVAGIDFSGAYTMEAGNYGKLDFSFRGSLFTKADQQEIPGGVVDDCVGVWGGACSRPTPEWKSTFTTIWSTPWDLTFVGAWRMVDGVKELSDNANAFDAKDEHYLDLTATYVPSFINFGETTFSLGVSNVTDNDPPVNGRFANVAVFGNGNTIPGTWDTMGRYFFVGVSQKF